MTTKPMYQWQRAVFIGCCLVCDALIQAFNAGPHWLNAVAIGSGGLWVISNAIEHRP